MVNIVFAGERCKGCGLCVAVCPKKLIVMDKETINPKGYHVAVCANPDECSGCASCARMCPDCAITIER